MSNIEELKENLSKHATIDSKINNLNKLATQLRKQRSQLETNIIDKMTSLNFENKKIKLNQTSYYIGINKQSPSLTLELIKSVATKLFDEPSALQLLNEINKYKEENKKETYLLKHKNINRKRSTKTNKLIQSQSLKKIL